MKSVWYYLTYSDYENIIKKLPSNSKLRWQLYSQWRQNRPMLKESYNILNKKYGKTVISSEKEE